MRLYNHQIETLIKIKECDRGVVNLPTGTGKTTIISTAIIQDVEKFPGVNVYVVLDPKIVLVDQVFQDVRRSTFETGKEFRFHLVHSGGLDREDLTEIKDLLKLAKKGGVKFSEADASCKPQALREAYELALRDNVPLLVFCTYKSAPQLTKVDLPYRMVMCDEAHHLVSTAGDDAQNAWIAVDFPTTKMFFFTATMRITHADDGVGMNNVQRFGPLLVQKSPKDMITDGIVVRPKLHIVEQPFEGEPDFFQRKTNDWTENDYKIWSDAIVDSFFHHVAEIQKYSPSMGGKVIVRTRGSEDVKQLSRFLRNDPRVQSQSIEVLEATSMYGRRRNGDRFNTSKAFLQHMQRLSDTTNAIILQITILSEGIDVPGITGIMPMTSLGVAEFSQLIGRAMRLHKVDRTALHEDLTLTTCIDDLPKYTKPYAWLIAPRFGGYTNDLVDRMRDLIEAERDFGWTPSETVETNIKRATPDEDGLESIDDSVDIEEEYKTKPSNVVSLNWIKFHHKIEDLIADEALEELRRRNNKIMQDNRMALLGQLKEETIDEKIAAFADFVEI